MVTIRPIKLPWSYTLNWMYVRAAKNNKKLYRKKKEKDNNFNEFFNKIMRISLKNKYKVKKGSIK
jgi:hypothetical protein